MAYTINTGKELASAPRPLLLADFTFADGAILHLSTLSVTFGIIDYTPAILEQEVDRLASLSEQGVDRIPSASLQIADPAGTIWTTWERGSGKGFKGATLLLRFALYDAAANEFSTDSFVPFLGICDQPALDEKLLTVSAQSKLNLAKFSLPTMAVQSRCPWRNPITTAQRTEAASAESRFYPCGETRDLVTAPPCEYNRQTCTQDIGTPKRYAGSTWKFEAAGGGRAYLSGSQIAWRNADTSGKYKQLVPLWLGGKVWLQAVVLNQVADANYTRGEALVGLGAIHVEKVVVNGITLDYTGGSADYRWHYVNNGARTGTPNTDVPYSGAGDPYGGFTVIQFLAPHSVISPESEATVKIFGWQTAIRVYTDESTYTSGTGILGSSLGGATSVWVLMQALAQARFEYTDFDLDTWVAAAAICDAEIDYTTSAGGSDTQPRFTSSVALRDRRSAADVARGIRQSIGAMLVPGQDGKLKIQIEGTLAEQQPSPVDGSNYDTAVTSKLRDGSSVHGHAAYRFTESNSWGWKRLAHSLAETPNRVAFSFSDPDADYSVSTFALVDSDDVSRMGAEQPGGLQVDPEGIASHNHALRCGKLGLAKIQRGNPAADTRGTDWFEWQTSFRGCKLTVGQIVVADESRLGLTLRPIRITEVKPARNFETVTLRGHWHNDNWYLDLPSTAADPEPTGTTIVPFSTAVPPGTLDFDPFQGEYGYAGAEHISVADPRGILGIDFYLISIDELISDPATGFWYSMAGVDGSTDPVDVVVAINPSYTGALAAAVGDWVLFNDPGSFEWGQIAAIVGGTWTIQRQWPGTPSGNATFSSLKAAHGSGIKVFICPLAGRRFVMPANNAGFDEASVPDTYDFHIPGHIVGAIVAAPFNAGGYGTWVVRNLATATLPGLRTCVGGEFSFPVVGELIESASIPVSMDFSVDADQPVRVVFAYLGTAPVGADFICKVKYSADKGVNWLELCILTIADGEKQSWANISPPQNRQEPYSGSWPYPILFGGYLLNVFVTQIGTDTSGADLMVKVDT